MGIFTRRKPIICPVCGDEFNGATDSLREDHWETHIWVVPEGRGPASGGYSWSCCYGPCGRGWDSKYSAVTALGVHIARHHRIDWKPELFGYGELVKFERELGIDEYVASGKARQRAKQARTEIAEGTLQSIRAAPAVSTKDTEAAAGLMQLYESVTRTHQSIWTFIDELAKVGGALSDRKLLEDAADIRDETQIQEYADEARQRPWRWLAAVAKHARRDNPALVSRILLFAHDQYGNSAALATNTENLGPLRPTLLADIANYGLQCAAVLPPEKVLFEDDEAALTAEHARDLSAATLLELSDSGVSSIDPVILARARSVFD